MSLSESIEIRIHQRCRNREPSMTIINLSNSDKIELSYTQYATLLNLLDSIEAFSQAVIAFLGSWTIGNPKLSTFQDLI